MTFNVWFDAFLSWKNNNKPTKSSLDQSQKIASLQKKIKETNFVEQSRKYFEMSFFERFKIFLSQITGNHPEVNLKDQGSDSKIFQHLLNQSVKRINIFEVYKDLIKLKMSVKLMLTKEQYAAMQFCGSDVLTDNQQSSSPDNQIPCKESNKNKQNIELLPSQLSDIKPYICSPTRSDTKQLANSSTEKINLAPLNNQSNHGIFQRKNKTLKVIFSQEGIIPQSNEQKSLRNESPQYSEQQQTSKCQAFSENQILCSKSAGRDLNKFQDKVEGKIYNHQNHQKNEQILFSTENTVAQQDYNKKIQIRKNKGDTIEVEKIEDSYFTSQEEYEEKQEQETQKRTKQRIQKEKVEEEKVEEENQKEGQFQQSKAETLQKTNQIEQRESKEYISDDILDKQFDFNNQGGNIFEINPIDEEANSPKENMLSYDQLHCIKSHLQEMDFIEENVDLQEKLLKSFLEDINNKLEANRDIAQLNNIDRQIFQSLLIEEEGYKFNNDQVQHHDNQNGQSNKQANTIYLEDNPSIEFHLNQQSCGAEEQYQSKR